MDPITAMATASAAFGTIKKGFQVGRDVESMMSVIGRWMGEPSDLDQAAKEAKNPPIFKKLFNGTSVEEEAMTAFANARKAREQRDELKNWIEFTLGRSAWQDLIQTEANIRKQRQETLYKQRERRQKFVEIIAWIVLVGIGSAILYGFVSFLMSKQARADEVKWTTCRLVNYERIKIKENPYTEYICTYRGANNTIESMTINEFCPREYQCVYNPRKKDEPTLKETLDSIRKELQ